MSRPPTPGYRPKVVLKFRDSVTLPYDDGVERHLDASGVGPWKALKTRFPGITIRRLFNSVTPAQISRLVAQARHRSEWYRPPNFLTYFVVDLPENVDTEKQGMRYSKDLIKALGEWPSVEKAYFEPEADEPENHSNPTRIAFDPDMPLQKYLSLATGGIGADFAWGIPGGDGAGVRFIDVERCWTRNHQDLKDHQAQIIWGEEREQSRAHGTSVLGVVCAARNEFGCRGIAHNVDAVDVVSWWGLDNSVAVAVEKANSALNPGDVLLIEVQQLDPVSGKRVPAEINTAEFDAIQLAVARGIIVIEAAGNAGIDLDLIVDADGVSPFAPGAKDSGAIIVGAATATIPHVPIATNFGSRVNCFAWGEKVYAPTSTGPNDVSGYVPTFDGTSSASAILAGAALVMQGIALAKFGSRLDSRQLRDVLSDPATATLSQNGLADRIGVMPDLKAIILQGVLGRFFAQNVPNP